MSYPFNKDFITGIEPREILDVDAWANTYRHLGPLSAEKGLYNSARTPYIRKIHQVLSPSSRVRVVVWRKSGQIGGTEAGNNLCGSIIDQHPGPTLMIMATQETARENSKLRIDPMISESPSLAAKVANKNSRESTNNVHQKDFPGGYLIITTAGSAAALSSKPVRFIILDEVSKYPTEATGEGDPVKLAFIRTFTFTGREKIYILSTPTVEGECRVSQALEDCEVIYNYHVPCPHCKHKQVLDFKKGLKCDRDEDENWIFSTACYECESCNERISENWKPWMLENGDWIAVKGADVEDPESVGFDRLNTLYAPIGLGPSWARILREFHSVKDRPAELKVFVNAWLAECWQEKGEAPDWELLFRTRREDYARGTVPEGGLILTAAADVQADRIEASVEARGRQGHVWLVDHHVFPGDTVTGAPWEALTAFLMRPVPHASGAELRINLLALDTGYRAHGTVGAYNWARKHGPRLVMPVKGRSPKTDEWYDSPSIVSHPSKIDVHLDGGRTLYRGLLLYTIGVSALKSAIYQQLKQPRPAPGEAFPGGWRHYPKDLDEEFFKSLTAESFVTVKEAGGRIKGRKWVKHYERNEQTDLAVMNEAAAYLLQIHKYTDDDWDYFEEQLKGGAKSPADAKQAAGYGMIDGGVEW